MRAGPACVRLAAGLPHNAAGRSHAGGKGSSTAVPAMASQGLAWPPTNLWDLLVSLCLGFIVF